MPTVINNAKVFNKKVSKNWKIGTVFVEVLFVRTDFVEVLLVRTVSVGTVFSHL